MFVNRINIAGSTVVFSSEKKQEGREKQNRNVSDAEKELINTLEVLSALNKSGIIGRKEEKRATLDQIKEELDNSGIPSKTSDDGMSVVVMFSKDDTPIRGYGRFYKSDAASRIINYKKGKLYSEKWLDDDGKISAIMNYSQKTGHMIRTTSFDKNGKPKSIVTFDENTGKRTTETYFKKDGRTVQRFKEIDPLTNEVIREYVSKDKNKDKDTAPKKKNIFQRIFKR